MQIRLGNQRYSIASEYQLLTSITCNGTQFIDTGYIPNYQKGFEIEIKYNLSTNKKRYCLLSNYNQGNAQLSLEVSAANESRLWMNSGNLDQKLSGNIVGDNISTFKYIGTTYTINCNETIKTGTYAKPSTQPTTSMYLGLDRAKRTSTFNSTISFYSCQIKEENNIIHIFKPCKRLRDGVVGMYDIITETFYPNQGTGSFVAGNKIGNIPFGIRGI